MRSAVVAGAPAINVAAGIRHGVASWRVYSGGAAQERRVLAAARHGEAAWCARQRVTGERRRSHACGGAAMLQQAWRELAAQRSVAVRCERYAQAYRHVRDKRHTKCALSSAVLAIMAVPLSIRPMQSASCA